MIVRCGASCSSRRYKVRIDGVAMNTNTSTGNRVHMNSNRLASDNSVLNSFVVVMVIKVRETASPMISDVIMA